jgi:hypothetical protein
MRGRAFLVLAREIVLGGKERHWRGAAGRAYYALMLECRETLIRWGFPMPPGDGGHRFARSRFSVPGNADLRFIVDRFDRLAPLRNKADYILTTLLEFSSDARAQDAIQIASDALDRLDAIEADSVRLANAVAAIRAVYP